MPSRNPEPQPLSLDRIAARITVRPLFLRRVARPTPWKQALLTGELANVTGYLIEEGGKVSLWQVQNDLDLRRVAIAVNESRESFTEMIDFLPILPDELTAVGATYEQTRGDTECPAAAQLHYDAAIDEERGSRIIAMLVRTGRELARCTRGQMAQAERDSIADGCFAVSDSTSCKCGEEPSRAAVSAAAVLKALRSSTPRTHRKLIALTKLPSLNPPCSKKPTTGHLTSTRPRMRLQAS